MKRAILACAAAGVVAAVPAIVSAQSVAASLSASFDGGSVIGIDVDGQSVTMAAPSSVSTAAAAGVFAAAGSVAHSGSSGAVAGASSTGDLTPIIGVTNSAGGVYETSVMFMEPGTLAAIDALRADLDLAQGDIQALQTGLASLQTTVDSICDQGGTTASFVIEDFVTGASPQGIQIFGYYVVNSVDLDTANITVNGLDVTITCV